AAVVAPPPPAGGEKFAVTAFAELIRIVHVVAVPPQAPLQPRNVAPVMAVAVRVTVEFCANGAEQMFAPLPQLIAPAPPLTAPLPFTVTARIGENVAVTLRSELMVRVHVGSLPVHATPLQPANTYPSEGCAVSITCAPAGSFV